ncbi:hypothetical protein VVD49_12470 [Uliginosibacterium sp. H3]|uniref:DUF6817 domain-containing protein n=1 Tax=Uliginosibacterium silvisoli TaxID=3114758 RepID=A0ABU6K3R4_9RHOO|nr:hypothetical protein [Uliginosibacterium sp. H3]
MPSDGDLLAFLEELGAGAITHMHGPLAEHLRGTAQLLRAWGNREALCRAGLYHAVYGTDGFDQSLIDLNLRSRISAVIGEEAETLAYLYCACDRKKFYPRIGTQQQLTFCDRFTNGEYAISESQLRDLCELTLANELELAEADADFRAQYGASLAQLFERMRPWVSSTGFETCNRLLG